MPGLFIHVTFDDMQMDVLQKLHIDLDAVHQIDLPGLVMMAYAIAVLEDNA